MQLFYRAQTFTCTPTTYRFIRPAAINWRYQVASEAVATMPVETVRKSVLPRALNWRYQIPAQA